MKQPPSPPKPPPCRIQYSGLLSSFVGPEDEFERWRNRPLQRVLARLEPIVGVLLPVMFFGLIVTMAWLEDAP
jgi:hypothetical protein